MKRGLGAVLLDFVSQHAALNPSPSHHLERMGARVAQCHLSETTAPTSHVRPPQHATVEWTRGSISCLVLADNSHERSVFWPSFQNEPLPLLS
eukprot:m.6777 g.6777  ORF g.6777 m.6777 type:complete len:93 (-) comp3880_c0_seq1:1135-1413(-)